MKKLYRRSISGLMALLICFTTILGGGITAFAASSSGEVAKSYSIGFPRSGDANLDYSGTWGHDELHYMNGWTSGEATWMTTLHTIGSFDGPACYCIEPGVPRLLEKTYTRYGEDYWKNYPSDYNSTIDADTIKTLLGRIMQYGYQGDLSLDWRSQNESDADKMAHMMATQVLVWETVVGERDANFNHVDPGSADAVKSVYRTSHPLYSRFSAYYDSIEASVQSHTVIPSFMSKTPNKAQTVELKWDGSQYTATLTDSNHVVSDYTFSSNLSDIIFTSNGDTLTITAKTAPAEPVTISAGKNNIRKGVVVWSDGHYGPDGTMQDAVTYAATVMDPVQAFLNLKVSYGSAKIVKTSEDGKVDNLTFTITGNGVNQTVKTNSKGEIQIDNLMPGVYTVTEMDYDRYEPQESRRVTVVSGQVSTVNFSNKLKRGDLQIIKSSEDNLNEGVTFHLYGTSLSGIPVDEYAVTDENGVATFEDVLISGSTPYTVEEVDTAIRYVVPEAQSAPINWNEVTNRSFLNILKKFSVTVTKSDAEIGTAQGDASLAGAVYGIYKGETLVDTYTTDKNGQFVTKEYICDNDWTVREITPSEGYLLDTTVHKVGAEPQLYTVEHNQTANDVTEQVVKGNIAIIKHTDNGETQIETPENGAEFAVYLKAAGSYDSAKASERDYLTCDENGFAQTKDMPYGIYTVHQVSGWEGSKLMPDFDVFISQNGATYRYLIRQGNENAEVHIYRFVTEETFDAYLYQLVEGKQKFASQIMTSKSPVRSCEDIDETALSYAEIKMLATGNPHIKEKMDLDIQVQKLRLLKSSFLSEKYALEDKIIKFYPQEIARRSDVIAGLKSDMERVAEHPKPSDETFVGMTVKGAFYSEKADAGNAILEACKAMTNPDPIPLGEYRGFTMELYFEAREYKVRLKGELGYPVTLGSDTFGNITRLDNALEGLPKRLEMNEMELDNLKKQFETAKVDVERPFPQEEELKAKTDRLNELNALLNVDKRENEIVGGEPDEGEEPPEKKPRDLER